MIAPQSASAQSAGQRSAYEYALKCWAVAGHQAADPAVRRSPTQLAAAQAGSKKAYQAAYAMGATLGYSKPQIARDLDATGHSEAAAMLQDRAYFERTRVACVRLGLN